MKPLHVDAILQVIGDAMSPEIHDTDFVFIRFNPRPDDGKIAAVALNGEATLKRIHYLPDGIILSSNNNFYPPMKFTGDEVKYVRIIGEMVGLLGLIHT